MCLFYLRDLGFLYFLVAMSVPVSIFVLSANNFIGSFLAAGSKEGVHELS